MTSLDRFYRALIHGCGVISAVLIGIVAVLVTVDVVMRNLGFGNLAAVEPVFEIVATGKDPCLVPLPHGVERTVLLRGTSSVTTGGLGNPLVSTAENAFSAVTAVLALVFPVLALILIVVIVGVAWRLIRSYRRRRPAGQDVDTG